MKNKSGVSISVISRMLGVATVAMLAACAQTGNYESYGPIATPTVDYIETLDVYSAPHHDSFLNQLAMNYRSYAIYNARTSGYSEMGELFANKAVAAFSGEVPFPESLENWPVESDALAFEIQSGYNNLMDYLKDGASEKHPQLAAEAQAKFDCWLSASASGQTKTAQQCRTRFLRAIETLKNCDNGTVVASDATPVSTPTYYPDTRNMAAMNGAARSRDGVIIVNNVNIPDNLITPVAVSEQRPLIFNQNIYGGDKTVDGTGNTETSTTVSDEYVTRAEFVDMMMAMRTELAAINARLDGLAAKSEEKAIIKVQQIPLEPTQHVMEEVFEVRFDFDKSIIKPEYQELIKKLVDATQENKNIKVSVIGHTDTMGSASYNYALGGRRAEAVQKMLIQYGIPASQIVAVSAGEEDLAVPTADGVANAANRRVQVIKEVHYTEPAPQSVTVVEEYTQTQECGMYGCGD